MYVCLCQFLLTLKKPNSTRFYEFPLIPPDKAAQMQGFFGKPVDDLHAEPLIARWIQHNVPNWREAVVVSKNPGGTKRVTSLADVLKLNFGIVTTDRRRGNLSVSTILDGANEVSPMAHQEERSLDQGPRDLVDGQDGRTNGHSTVAATMSGADAHTREGTEDSDDSADGRAQDVITGRLVHGHLVDDDFPSPTTSLSASVATIAGENGTEPAPDTTTATMTASIFSSSSRFSSLAEQGLTGAGVDGGVSSDEEEEAPEKAMPEQMITLVGNVRGKTVFIVDDIIDKARSWIAAAETVVKRGGARRVFCIATHGLFGSNGLEEIAKCDCIDHVVVTNSCPIPIEDRNSIATKKLAILDISNLLSEAIRRNHYGQ